MKRYKVGWPSEFDKEVLSTFEILKKRHSILIGKVSGRVATCWRFATKGSSDHSLKEQVPDSSNDQAEHTWQ